MNYDVILDKTSRIPSYRQMADQVLAFIRLGQLSPGTRLPSEREWAQKLGVSRGTVQRALLELVSDGAVEQIQGSGCFVSYPRDGEADLNRKDLALAKVSQLIEELENLRFSYREIGSFIQLALMERERKRADFHVAVIDCNREALFTFRTELGHHLPFQYHEFLLDELKAFRDVQERLSVHDLIFVSTTHYAEVLELAPGIKDILLQAAMTPKGASLAALSKIPNQSKTLIMSLSPRFAELVQSWLNQFERKAQAVQLCGATENSLALFDFDTVIAPSESLLDFPCRKALGDFRAKGGHVVHFEYHIEKGSLVYLEKQIAETLKGKP